MIDYIEGHYLNVSKCNPLEGKSYIPLPKKLQHHKKGLININNKDDKCFLWCHVRHLNPQETNPQRIERTDKELAEQLNYEGIEFPVKAKHYNKIEVQNKIKINVFGYENKQFYPTYKSKNAEYEDEMNSLLIANDETNHYVYIQDFNRIMYNKTKNKNKKHFCMSCLQCFSSEYIVEQRKTICLEINGLQAVRMPEPGSKVLFKNYHRQMQVPFVIYADFEAITEKIQGCNMNDQQSYTDKYQKHTGCGYGHKLVCCYNDKYSRTIQVYRGEDSIEKFMY